MRALALIPMLAACSLSVSTVLCDYQPRPGGPPPPCEDAFAGRALADVVGVGFGFLGYLLYGFSNLPCQYGETCDREVTAALPGLIPAALYAAAIGYGATVANNCTRVRSEYCRLQR
jgi:hypothetical protein